MSTFDKLVANWVSSADSRPVEERTAILANITKNLEAYRELENPSEAYARKMAEKKRIEDEKRKAEEEEKRAYEERRKQREAERQRNLEVRRASLPPLPPSTKKAQSKAAQTTDASRQNRAPSKKTTSAPAKAAAAEEPIISEEEKARLDARRLGFRNVDFSFEDDVSAAIQRLQQQQQHGKPRAPSKRLFAGSSLSSSTSSIKKLDKINAKAKAVDEKAAACSSSISTGSQPEPPITPFALNTHKPSNPEAGVSSTRVKPPVLTMIEQEDNNDENQLHEDELQEKQAMELFTFGATHNEPSDADKTPRSDVNGDGDASHEDNEIIPDEVDRLLRTNQQKRPSRMGISDASLDLDEARTASFPPTPKSRDTVRIITKVLEKHYLFSFLDDADIARFASVMDLEEFKEGTDILTKGASNDTLFLILDGEAEVGVKGEKEGEEELLVLGKGATVGDVALMYETSNPSTVTAKTDVQCASLERKTYKMLASRSMAERRENYTQFLSETPFFSDLPKEEITRLAEALKAATYNEGEKVIELGGAESGLFLVLEGALQVLGRDGQSVATVERGGFVGHVELLFHHAAVADVVAASPVVKTAKLGSAQFDRLPSATCERMVKEIEEGEHYQYYRDAMKNANEPVKDEFDALSTPKDV